MSVESVIRGLAPSLVPPGGSARVIVSGDPRLVDEYLDARATVIGLEGGEPDPRFHVRLPADDSGLPGPRRDGSADLVLIPRPSPDRLDALIPAVRKALAPGGFVVLGMPRSSSRRTRARLMTSGLLVRERIELDAHDVLVASDPRPPVVLPLALAEIDRSTCIDRERLLDLVERPPWPGPDPQGSGGTVAELISALEEATARGAEPDPSALPWPALGAPSSADRPAGCDVLVLMPHPDDESIYVGGTIAGLVAAGRRVRLVTVTDGAGGRGGDDLSYRRKRELRTAAEHLGIESVRVLGWSDFGKYRDAARTEPATAGDAVRVWGARRAITGLVAEIRCARPRWVLSLDPEIDPNLSLHGHHLGLGLLVAAAFHAAADPDFEPAAGLAWAPDEHRVAVPGAHARWSDAFEIDRELERRALAAHATQGYSTARLLEALADPDRPAIEHTRRLQSRRPLPWLLVRHRGDTIDDGTDWAADADRVTAVPRPRAELVEVLRRQAGPSPSAAIEASLRGLARDDSVAIVTGQQVGLLGGPVYTLAKALTAVAVARRLRRQGIHAVPIFWLASQDHDLDEVQRVPRLDAPPLTLAGAPDGRPVGSRPLGPEVDELWARWRRELPPHADPELVARLRDMCGRDATFTESFRQVLRTATGDTELLVLDPADPAIARLARPLLRRALHEASAVDEALVHARERLHRAGLEETIPTTRGATQVFRLDHDGARRRLDRGSLDATALDYQLESSPERFSPAALLRPLVQDSVLPTIAYVGGPTERRYLEQTAELYAWAGIPRPRTIARASLLTVDGHDLRALTTAGGLDALRADPRPLERIGRAGLPAGAVRWLESIEALVDALADGSRLDPATLRTGIEAVTDPDPSAVRTLPRARTMWPRYRAELRERSAAVLDEPSRARSRRSVALLRRALLRLRRSLLRDGRRLRPKAIEAWRRVSSDPAPPERRTTVAELFVRAGPSLSSTLLAALEHEPSAELTVIMGGTA